MLIAMSAIGGLVVISIARRRAAAIPAAILAVVLWILGVFGGFGWDWSRENNASGLPESFETKTGLDSVATEVLLFAALGASVGGILLAAFNSTKPPNLTSPILLSRAQSMALLAATTGLLLAWLGGQGPSVLERDQYLAADGVDALLRTTSYFGPMMGMTAFGIAVLARRCPFLFAHIVVAVAWWALLASTGTRLAAAFPLVVTVLIVLSLKSTRTLGLLVIKLAGVFATCYLALATFQITQVVRASPHGLTNLARLSEHESMPSMFDLESWVDSFQGVISSITAAIPIISESAAHPPPLSVIIINANPLPTGIVASDAFNSERLWPYVWVPLAFLGELHGLFGPAGPAVLLFAIALLSGAAVVIAATMDSRAGVFFVLLLCALFVTVAIQYPSRNAWRLAWAVAAAPVILLALRHRRRRRQAIAESVGDPPNHAAGPPVRSQPERSGDGAHLGSTNAHRT